MRLNNLATFLGNLFTNLIKTKFIPAARLMPCIPVQSFVIASCAKIISHSTLPVIVFWMNLLNVLDMNSSLWAKTEPDSCRLYPLPFSSLSFQPFSYPFFFATSSTSTKPQKCKGWTSCPVNVFFPPNFFPLFLLFNFLSWDRQFPLVTPRPMVSFVHIWSPWTSTFHSSFTPSCVCAMASRPPLSSVGEKKTGPGSCAVCFHVHDEATWLNWWRQCGSFESGSYWLVEKGRNWRKGIVCVEGHHSAEQKTSLLLVNQIINKYEQK